MTDYINSISNADSSPTSAVLNCDGTTIEISEQPPQKTVSSTSSIDFQSIQDNMRYLSPKKILLRKYTLKKS